MTLKLRAAQDTRERRTRRRKCYNPDIQTIPQDTLTSEAKDNGYQMTNARSIFIRTMVQNSTRLNFDPSVINSYPAHLKPPIQAIQGFDRSTILVTGYGYIDWSRRKA